MIILLCLITCSIFSFSRCETALLIPTGKVTICPNEVVTFACRTTNGALVWKTSSETIEKAINDEAQNASNLGIFCLRVNGVRKQGSTVFEVNSTATTVTGVQLKDDNTTLSCTAGSSFVKKDAFLRVAGPPVAPNVTLLANSSSLLISWTISDCAVQYEVTINSSDGSVYSNITTSDTNTAVTLPNGVEYCVTVAAVDAIGRRSSVSVPICYDGVRLVALAALFIIIGVVMFVIALVITFVLLCCVFRHRKESKNQITANQKAFIAMPETEQNAAHASADHDVEDFPASQDSTDEFVNIMTEKGPTWVPLYQ